MNDIDKQEFNRITEIDPEALQPHEIDFLYARRGYLNKGDKDTYRGVLKIKDEAVAEAAKASEEVE